MISYSTTQDHDQYADVQTIRTRQRWETIAHSRDLAQFIYVAKNDLEQQGISTDLWTLEHWHKVRRWLPVIASPLDDEERQALQVSMDSILAMMAELNKWALVIWLSRVKKEKHGKDDRGGIGVTGGIGGKGIVVGDGESEVTVIEVTSGPTYNFNFNVFIDSSPREGEAKPVLALGHPDKSVQFLPISQDYLPYEEDILRKAIEKLNSPNPSERVWATEIIRERGSKQDVDAVIPLLSDSEDRVKQLAADTIGERSHREASPALKGILKGLNSIGSLGETIALALLETGDRNAIPFLASLYAKVANAERLRLPIAAVCLSQDDSFEALIGAARNGDKATRMGAIALLADIFQEPSTPQLSKVWSY